MLLNLTLFIIIPQDDARSLNFDREDDDDFDALNDETFGTEANTGDWENQHRQLSGLLAQEEASKVTQDKSIFISTIACVIYPYKEANNT